jgi:hypothetical protein
LASTAENQAMKQTQSLARVEFPRGDLLDDDDRDLWSLDDLYELSVRIQAPLDHEIVVPSEGLEDSVPPPPHGASWDPF